MPKKPQVNDLVYGGHEGCEHGRIRQILEERPRSRFKVQVSDPSNPNDGVEDVVIKAMTPTQELDDLLGWVTFTWEYDYDEEW